MIERLVIGRLTSPVMDYLYQTRKEAVITVIEASHSQLPSEIFIQTENLVTAPETHTVVTVDSTAIYCAVDADRDTPLDRVWLALPLENPDHVRKLTDLLDENWLAHFSLGNLWMTSRLQGEIERALEKEKQPTLPVKPKSVKKHFLKKPAQ